MSKATAYARHRDVTARKQAEQSRAGRDIAPMPPVKKPRRKSGCRLDFRLFCETYLAATFAKPWSKDHLRIIERIERAVLEGGQFAMAMPRGSGKTTLAESACIWALLYGHRRFVAMIGAEKMHAVALLNTVKSALTNNPMLLADFPEAVYPVRCLDGIHQRASGQLFHGKRTEISWTNDGIVLPTIPGSSASGAVVQVAGITGAVRGMKHPLMDGSSIRPELAIVDDPQTDPSAKSVSQCNQREDILAGAVLGMAGPGQTIAALMPTTVICADDMADRILDPKRHPEWQSERMRMLNAFPANEKLWAEYTELRQEAQRTGKAPSAVAKACAKFYRKHRKAMDKGADVTWEARFDSAYEVSGLQAAMNIFIDRREECFWAEYQNEPLPPNRGTDAVLSVDHIQEKLNKVKRRIVPLEAVRLTMYIDVHKRLLYWVVVAWADNFTGWVIDYGSEPEQAARHFSMHNCKMTLARKAPGAGEEAQIYAGLERLTERVLGREWAREDGSVIRIGLCLIDSGYETSLVYAFCRRNQFANILWPAKGIGVGAANIPFDEYRKRRGDRTGWGWRIPSMIGKRASRHVLIDTNLWKTMVQARLAVAIGDPGCLSLCGNKPVEHRMFAEHLWAEYPVKTEGRGRVVNQWTERHKGNDNHFLDCVVGNAVAASIGGSALPGVTLHERRKRKVVRLSERKGKRW